LEAIEYPRPTNRCTDADNQDDTYITCKARLLSWLPVYVPVVTHKAMSDVYVHDRNTGYVLVLGEVMNHLNDVDKKLRQLQSQMLYCLRPEQKRMFGLVFTNKGVLLVDYEVKVPHMTRCQSKYMFYENDGLRRAFEHILTFFKDK
jgi:hypothetical protein